MSVAEYRAAALAVALDPRDSRHLLPSVPANAIRILDVGCHAGHILEALKLPKECQVFGCDVDTEALQLAKQCMPHVSFSEAPAEALPYKDSSFDFVFSRGVIVVVNIPYALVEFNRVLVAKGRLWISLHRFDDCVFIWRGSWKSNRLKTLAFAAYTVLNSWLFHFFGKLARYPLNKSRMMSFQTENRMRKELEKAGFGDISFTRGKYLVVSAEKLRDVK